MGEMNTERLLANVTKTELLDAARTVALCSNSKQLGIVCELLSRAGIPIDFVVKLKPRMDIDKAEKIRNILSYGVVCERREKVTDREYATDILKSMHNDYNLSFGEIANLVGIDRTQIYRFVNGERLLSNDCDIQRIIESYGQGQTTNNK